MKGNNIYFFLLGFQFALGLIYIGDTFFAGSSNNDATSNVETQKDVSSSLSVHSGEDNEAAAKAARIFLGGGVPDVNLSGSSTTTTAVVEEKTAQKKKKKETVKIEKKEEDTEKTKTKKNLRSSSSDTNKKTKNTPLLLGPGGQPLDETYRRSLQVEQHFMIDWTQYYTEKEFTKIMKDEWPNLEIRKMITHPVQTNDTERQTLWSEFYGMDLSIFESQERQQFRGATPFNMYYIHDTNPNYDLRRKRTSKKSARIVNTSMFDFKKKLREGMGGGFKVHATDNIQETKDNLKVLGQLDSEYTIRKFDTLRQLFDVLNFSGLEYVVLRNFEKMPDEVNIDPDHLDVDILVSDYYDAKRILDGDTPAKLFDVSVENGYYRIMNDVYIDGKQISFDIREVGDNYVDTKWESDILKRRILSESGLYVPSKDDHFYSLIYHAIIQKKEISDTYVTVFRDGGGYTEKQAKDKVFLRKKLDDYMSKNGYSMVKPRDETVKYFVDAGLAEKK